MPKSGNISEQLHDKHHKLENSPYKKSLNNTPIAFEEEKKEDKQEKTD